MARQDGRKISELDVDSSLSGEELVPLVDGSTKRTTTGAIAALGANQEAIGPIVEAVLEQLWPTLSPLMLEAAEMGYQFIGSPENCAPNDSNEHSSRMIRSGPFAMMGGRFHMNFTGAGDKSFQFAVVGLPAQAHLSSGVCTVRIDDEVHLAKLSVSGAAEMRILFQNAVETGSGIFEFMVCYYIGSSGPILTP